MSLHNPHRTNARAAFVDKLALIKDIRETAKASDNLAIPTLIVTGSQTTGKSTVMTSVTGVQFPSAAGICTKAPTVVSCSRVPELQQNEFEIEDVHNKGIYKCVQAGNVPAEILKAQRTLLAKAGKRSGDTWIVKDEIRLRVRGPEMLDVILVDLPGLIENAPDKVTAEQLEQLKKQLEEVIAGYAGKPEALIAVVQGAGEDIERVPAVRLALKFDPQRKRTFKILNKCDVLATSDESRKLAVQAVNDEKNQKFGPHALIRRTTGGDIKDPADELQELRDMGFCSERSGIATLKERLEKMFARLIDANLPRLKMSIESGLEHAQKELSAIGKEEIPSFSMVQEFVQTLEKGESDLTKMLSPAVKKFGDAVHGERKAVTLEFVSEGYVHDAAKPSELQLEENFEKSLVKVAGLWKPHLDEYMESVRAALEKWFRAKLSASCGRSGKLRGVLQTKFDDLKAELLMRFRDASLRALDAERCFGTINDHYFNAKRRKYDACPKELEDRLMEAAKQIIGEAVRYNDGGQRLDTMPAPAAGGWGTVNGVDIKGFKGTLRDALIHSSAMQFQQKFVEIRDDIKTKQEDMVEHNKQETHTLVMANFDVACKVFRDNVWKRTLEMIRPTPHKTYAGGSRKGKHYEKTQAVTVMDWTKYFVISDQSILTAAGEDEDIRHRRAELKVDIKRLESCLAKLRTLWISCSARGGAPAAPHSRQEEESRYSRSG